MAMGSMNVGMQLVLFHTAQKVKNDCPNPDGNVCMYATIERVFIPRIIDIALQ